MEKGYSTDNPPEEYMGPSWTTIRSNYWKGQANMPGAEEKWCKHNIRSMLQGKSPIKDGQKIILHHPFGRNGKNVENFKEMPVNEHIKFHREYGYHYDPIFGWH